MSGTRTEDITNALNPSSCRSPAAGNWKLTTGNSPRILVVRLGSLGDIVHTLPAVGMLRSAIPNAFIGWVIEERWAELLCSRAELHSGRVALSQEKPLVNSVHVVTTRTWRRHPFTRDTRRQIAATVRELRGGSYDVALDFQSAIRSAVIGRLACPKQFIGFSHAHEAPASLFYTRRVEAAGRHMVEQNASLASSFRAGSNSERSESSFEVEGQRPTANGFNFHLPSDPVHATWAAEHLAHLNISNFCLLNAGAGWGAKIWPAERWAEVARALVKQGLHCVINYGPGEEDIARRVEQQSDGAATAISSSIGQLIALARRASLCIGGDTGPTHLAAALGVPVVAIYGPTDPARNGPFGPSHSTAQIIVLRSQASITDHARRAGPEIGLLQISPQHVIQAAKQVLSK